MTKRVSETNLRVIPGKAKSNVEDDVDGLFQRPLSEFIDARKILSARLKQEGRTDEANRIKALTKPSVSAWVVNQLHWQNQALFDRLMATGEEIRRAQKAGKILEMRDALDARRYVLSQLSDLATGLLRDAGSNPSLDMIRRVATTLEAMSAYAALPEGMSAGRLTKDIDPPGFDSLAGFTAAAPIANRTVQPAASPKRLSKPAAVVKPSPKQKPVDEKNLRKEAHQAKLAAAKASVLEAKKSLVAARLQVQSLAASQKRAEVEAKQAEKQKREAEQRFKSASTASAEAAVRVQRIAAELGRAQKTVEDAGRAVDRAAHELAAVFRNK